MVEEVSGVESAHEFIFPGMYFLEFFGRNDSLPVSIKLMLIYVWFCERSFYLELYKMHARIEKQIFEKIRPGRVAAKTVFP